MPSAADPARVLVAVLVYNGRDFVPRCLESIGRLEKGSSEADVLILDDHSPEPGWSEELSELCTSHGFGYYRSPRNLGIPRNFNLGVLRAVSAGYDYVVLLNSDVVVPYNLVDQLVLTARANEGVGTVTAWSNNCSIYSLPNEDPDRFLAEQDDVEWISDTLGEWSSPAGVEIPVGVGFCLLLPVEAVGELGLFDPVFGRGYCEENDWCLRARAAGRHNLLATNVFAYHIGGASTRGAGLVAPGETTVHAHERIIDWRHPEYRQVLRDFDRSGVLPRVKTAAVRQIVLSAARRWGYDLRLTSLPGSSDVGRAVHFVLRPEAGGTAVTGSFRGFTAHFHLDQGSSVLDSMVGLVGQRPTSTVIGVRGAVADDLAREAAKAKLPVILRNSYPESI